MSVRLFDLARQRFLGDGVTTVSWVSDTIKLIPLNLDGSLTGPAVKALTNATNATPIVCTSNGHGFSNGDIVVIRAVVGNLAANNTFAIANVAANTFELQTVPTSTQAAQQSTGSGAYVSGGTVINLTKGSFLSDINGARNAGATDTVALTGKTATNGVANSNSGTFASFPNAQVLTGFASYKDTGVAGTSPLIHFGDGKQLVRAAEIYTANDPNIAVDPLEGGIASGTVMVFTNGVSLTTSALASAGDTIITVTPAAVVLRAGDTCDVLSNVTLTLPITGNGGDITMVPDAGVNHWFKL